MVIIVYKIHASHLLKLITLLKTDNTSYADNDLESLVNFGPVALFSEVKLTTSSEKSSENVQNLHAIKAMHKLFFSNPRSEIWF